MILFKFLNYFNFKPFRPFGYFVLGAIIGAWVLFDILTLAVFWVERNYQDKVYPGVFVFSTSVSGKTQGELEEFLAKKEDEASKAKIIFFWKNNGEKKWEVTPGIIDFSLDKAKIIKEAFLKGRDKGGWRNLLEIYRLLVFPQKIEVNFSHNQEKLTDILEKMSLEVDRPVQDALFEFKDGKVSNFQPSKEGRAVDQNQVRSLVLLAFGQIPGDKVISPELPVKVVLPRTTSDQTNSLGIRELLAEGESFFKDSISSRVYNIILASSYLHGIVIPPGEVFSFSEKIGTISAQTGYKQAYIIKERKTILEDGGGVCQVSTTMFRAALSAGLPILERQPHLYRVGFYEQGGYPPGLDATVYPPSPDLKFKNDTPAHILIQTEIDKEKKRLSFKFYGTSDARKVEIEKPVIHSQTPPPEPIYIDDPTLPSGVVKKMDSSHWGAKVSFTRRVWASSGQLLEEKTFWSNYVPWAAVYLRGTKQ